MGIPDLTSISELKASRPELQHLFADGFAPKIETYFPSID